MNLQTHYEIAKGEQLKSAAEVMLHQMGRQALGRKALELYAFGLGGRIVDPALHTEIDGIHLENPIIVGAGWDKKGRAVLGLHALGFSAVEVGTVPLFGQYGNDKPRLWTIDKGHSVGMNRLGFNSIGAEGVDKNLGQHGEIDFPLGINLGLNKLMPIQQAAWAHAAVLKHVYSYASYIALGISSPNTAQVRGLQRKQPLTEVTIAVQEAMTQLGVVLPLYYKIDGDQSQQQIHELLEVAVENNVNGIVAINSTNDTAIKAKYGQRWANEAGGLTGADEDYRRKATETVRFIHEESGDKLTVMGVGGVDSAATALEKIKAGASVVQLVTAIRPSWFKVAAHINRGLVEQMQHDGVRNIREYVGVDTVRGAKAA
jgi:dihydroorotate dehydrogenase